MIAGTSGRAQEWQPIETAPKDGTWVMVGNHNGPCIARWGRTPYVEGWFNGRWYSDNQTHWMPLPEPPVPAEDR